MADIAPPKLVLLAAHYASHGAVGALAALVASARDTLHTRLVLRLLLTYLPCHLATAEYLGLIESLDTDDYIAFAPLHAPTAADLPPAIHTLTDELALKRVKKMKLKPLELPDGCTLARDDDEKESDEEKDNLLTFLVLRAYAVDAGAGALPEVLPLLAPFFGRAPRLCRWALSVVLPLRRRSIDYYPQTPLDEALLEFERLPGRLAVTKLLAQTGGGGDDRLEHIGRDLRGLLAPWLYGETRWTGTDDARACPGWEAALLWLTAQAGQAASWRVAVQAIAQWDGPGDADVDGLGTAWLADDDQQCLERRWARAALACVYLVPEASDEAFSGVHGIVAKIVDLLDQDPMPSTLAADLALLPPIGLDADLLQPRHAVQLRSGLLDESNVLTEPARGATELLRALVLSAALLTRNSGSACTVRRAGELALLRSEREQTAAATAVLQWLATHGPKTDDRFWIKARNDLLWLRDWGADEGGHGGHGGVLGLVSRTFIETEFLSILLANTRYTLARALYEDAPDRPLAPDEVRACVFAAAMRAYDSATNPNRTRGGLKKCDDILRAFPATVDPASAQGRRAEALLQATHALGAFRLVLAQGQPFAPAVLRAHEDPLALVSTVLAQNAQSYTRLQSLVAIARSIVDAGLPESDPTDLDRRRQLAERRVTAMCIDAALAEDDFEMAYSYVTSRLDTDDTTETVDTDAWSWRAALAAGKYRATGRAAPTHLGLASANPAIRHLHQRMACIAAAARLAPPDALFDIVNVYRRCEEELEVAESAEDAQASAWDDAADRAWTGGRATSRTGRAGAMPGAFDEPGVQRSTPMASRAAAAAASTTLGRRPPASSKDDDAPLSLFDLSRATARVAQRNFTALSSLRQARQLVGEPVADTSTAHDDHGVHVRKRDQLRDAAMGTLTSGVGWLIGAPSNPERLDR